MDKKKTLISVKKWFRKRRCENTIILEDIQSGCQMTANQHYLYNTLRLRGIVVSLNQPFGSFTADLFLPGHRVLILCIQNANDPIQKVRCRQMIKFTKPLGYKILIVSTERFYKDMQKVFLYTRFYSSNTKQHQKSIP